MDKSLINIRKAKESDKNYIINTWLRSFREHTTWKLIKAMPITEYNVRYRAIILSILNSPAVSVEVITPASEPELIIGYAVSELSTLHYIHIKRAYQRLGLSQLLIGHLFDGRRMKYSHITTPFNKAFKIDPAMWDYCPWLILGNQNLGDYEKGDSK